MKVSVALCTYNGERFLRQQLDSIARQTRLPDELVACDDRSKDGTLGILEAFGARAAFPLQIGQNEHNLGSTRNFAKAIRLCSGDIIVLCDQDDVWVPEKLEKLEAAFQKNPDIGYAFSDGELVDENLQPLGRRVWESNQFQGEFLSRYVCGEQLLCFLRWQFVTGATMAFRSRLKDYIFPFSDDKIWIHDGWIAVVGSAIGEVGLPIDEPLILYRQHGLQQVGANLTNRPKGLWNDFLTLKENRQEFMQKWAESSAFFQHLRQHLCALPVSKEPATAKSIETLAQFERHFQNRLKIFSGRVPRNFLPIAGELFSGRYGKFSNSWKSALADLLL